jgi:hypothetical protein
MGKSSRFPQHLKIDVFQDVGTLIGQTFWTYQAICQPIENKLNTNHSSLKIELEKMVNTDPNHLLPFRVVFREKLKLIGTIRDVKGARLVFNRLNLWDYVEAGGGPVLYHK